MAKTPRLDPYLRLLYRLYEALYLLQILGRVRGPHHVANLDFSTLLAVRRRFLKNIAFLCDYTKGGLTSTAVAIESGPECNIIWVASNEGPQEARVRTFLESVITNAKAIDLMSGDQKTQAKADLTSQCIAFASSRINKQARGLSNSARKCREFIMKTLIDQQDLAKWLRQFEFSNFKNLTNICQCAYKVRKDSEMDLLLTLSGELGNGEATIPTTIAPSFRKVRHIVGRLAAYIRTVEAVLDDMHHMGDLLDVFKVAVVPRPTCVPRLQADAHTNLSGILTRMLRAQDPDFTATFEYLSALDAQTGLESQLKDLFDPEKTSPSVHAEIQMLHHFYDNDRKFFAYDNYIATSKPACFCCKLYFRHHPADYVEPDSHEKVYTNWGPICLTSGSRGRRDDPHWIAQRKILNTVIADLDREVVNEIKRRRSLAEHPDTLTELTASSQTLWGDSSDTLYDETDVSVGFGSETHSDSDGGAGI